jgi:hypothetical protein
MKSDKDIKEGKTIESKTTDIDIKEKIEMIMRQTNYNEETIKEKLVFFDYDHLLVIKDYLGIAIVKKSEPIKSINQEIYKQIRNNLYTVNSNYVNKE